MTRQHALTPKPPLGWNSFDCYGCAATEEDIFSNLEAMALKLKPFGYEYFVIDNGWFGEYQKEPGKKYSAQVHAGDVNIDSYGRFIPSVSNFPNGIKSIAKRAHELGLKFGIHLMRGISRKAVNLNLPIYGTGYRASDIANTGDTCSWCPYNYGVDMTKPGAQEFYDSVIGLFADWGVDFLKVDDVTAFPLEIEAIAKAIEKCGRDIVLSLSPGGRTTIRNMKSYLKANMLRTTCDIWDNKESLDRAFYAWKRFQGYETPGFWLDLDMIPFGRLQLWRPRLDNQEMVTSQEQELSGKGHDRMSGLNGDQKRTFITMRAMAASPLFMGGDLITSDDYSFSLITNKHMLECNQNGIMGKLIHQNNKIEVWHTPLRGVPGSGWIGIFNRAVRATEINLTELEIPLLFNASFRLYDIWNDTSLGKFKGSIKHTIGGDGVLFIKYDAQDIQSK